MPHLLPNAILAALLVASIGCADADASQPRRSVQFDAARLEDENQARRLLADLETAARQACRFENRHSATVGRARRSCVGDTLDRAVADIAAPCLTALHETPLPERPDVSCNTLTRQFAAAGEIE